MICPLMSGLEAHKELSYYNWINWYYIQLASFGQCQLVKNCYLSQVIVLLTLDTKVFNEIIFSHLEPYDTEDEVDYVC